MMPDHEAIQALSIECKAQAKPLIEKLLGPATIVVKNGGVLYLNYRLKKLADGADESKKLEFAAKLAVTCEFVAKSAASLRRTCTSRSLIRNSARSSTRTPASRSTLMPQSGSW